MRMTILILSGKQVLSSNREVVMAVVSGGWHKPFQEAFEIFDQTRLIFIDKDRCGCVERLDVDQSVDDSRLEHGILDRIRDINELQTGLSLELKRMVRHFEVWDLMYQRHESHG